MCWHSIADMTVQGLAMCPQCLYFMLSQVVGTEASANKLPVQSELRGGASPVPLAFSSSCLFGQTLDSAITANYCCYRVHREGQHLHHLLLFLVQCIDSTVSLLPAAIAVR